MKLSIADLSTSEDLKSLYDPVVEKILGLVSQQNQTITKLKAPAIKVRPHNPSLETTLRRR